VNSKPYIAAASLIAAMAAAPAGADERTRAYVLIETGDSADVAGIHDALGSLPNCKAVVESLMPGESVAHVDCSDTDSLKHVVTEEIPGLEGVTRATMWIMTRPQ